MILAYATALEMDLVVYDNEDRWVMYGRHKGYSWKPENRRGGKGVHYVGTTILEEPPKNPELSMNLDFPEDESELKKIWDTIRNETAAWLEKELGWGFETHHEKIHYFMGQLLGELWKNVQDHGGRKGYFYLEKEYDPLLNQEIFHFVVGDKGK